MKRSEVFKGKYLKGADLEDCDLDMTIKDCTMVQIGEDDPGPKPVLSFEDGQPMVLNGINWDTIETMYGDDSDSWRGKKIRLWFDPTVIMAGKRVGGVRVRTATELPEGWSKSKLVSKSADLDESDIPF